MIKKLLLAGTIALTISACGSSITNNNSYSAGYQYGDTTMNATALNYQGISDDSSTPGLMCEDAISQGDALGYDQNQWGAGCEAGWIARGGDD